MKIGDKGSSYMVIQHIGDEEWVTCMTEENEEAIFGSKKEAKNFAEDLESEYPSYKGSLFVMKQKREVVA